MSPTKWLSALLGIALVAGISAGVAGAGVLFGMVRELSKELALVNALRDDSFAVTSEVFDRRGEKIGEFATERRYFVPLKKLPKHVVQAFLAAEDKDFYTHRGVAPLAIVRSAIANLRGRTIRQGASTITQQLARIYFLDQTKSWTRKAKEALLALAIESRWSKDQILELYLNKIFLGNKSFGIEAASRNYFRKNAVDLSVGEAALLAGLPKAPTYYAPHRHAERATKRQAFVLKRMAEEKFILPKDAEAWTKYQITVATEPEDHFSKAPYFIAAVQREFERRFETAKLPQEGLRIRTTLDLRLQRAAQSSLADALQKLRRSAVQPHRAKGAVEGALIALDPQSGSVLAMQGGEDFGSSQYNRSESLKRRLGGLYLPLAMSLALERGFTLASPIGADPMQKPKGTGDLAEPSLFELLLRGSVMDGARLYGALGGGTMVEHLKRLGLEVEREDATIALGYTEASPLQVARAFTAFVNGGRPVTPYMIDRIEDATGRALFEGGRAGSAGPSEAALSPQTAFIVNQALQEAVKNGHADQAGGASPVLGGVSGATDDLQNAWQVGILPNMVTAVWLGAETGRVRLADSEGAAADLAERAFAQFLRAAPRAMIKAAQPLARPAGVAFAPLRRQDQAGRAITVPFLSGTEPRPAPQQGVRF